ncbi:MAG: TlyA family RNA methyltransferase [Chloroflexi bacterium]|nr:TlyA family RNA methyltransferase [Chloroflexota bacterium]
MKRRLDLLLVERGLAESRQRAQALIMAGAVTVSGKVVDKAGAMFPLEADIAVMPSPQFASRGGWKLGKALDEFRVDPGGLVCLDVGASTGGFTDCLLQRGAARVYAVDVGRGQLDWRLRQDPRVVVLDKTNIRYLESLPEPVDLATVDVSFISLRLVLPAVVRLSKPEGRAICLVKPQFEAGRDKVDKGGVVREPSVHREVLEGLLKWSLERGWVVRGLTTSPIKGPAGNVEYLLYLAKMGENIDWPRAIDGCLGSRGD